MLPYKGQKKDFADLIKLSVLRWRDYPGRPLNATIGILIREEQREI